MEKKYNDLKNYNSFNSKMKIVLSILKDTECYEKLNDSLKNKNNHNKFSFIDSFIKELYNKNVALMSDEMFDEELVSSALFENYVMKLKNEDKYKMAHTLYETFINPMLICYNNNNDLELANYIYLEMNETIKGLSGYYDIYKNKIK